MLRSRTLFTFLAVVLALAGSRTLGAQSAVEIIGRQEPIPAGFKTYSLFLICNPQWLDPAKSSGLIQLYHQFQAFGRATGDDQAAVWFWRTTVQPGWESHLAPADIIDVERSVRFCKAWKLKPSEGPHLVVTSTRPDEEHLSEGLPMNSAVFKLGDMAPADISSLLSKLTDSLIESGKVDNSLAASSSPSTPSAGATPPGGNTLWVRMLSATQQMINDFGCAWSFKIDAGPVSANLKSCKASS